MTRCLNSPLRWFGASLLLITAATHIPLVSSHLQEAPYIGVLFIALSVLSLALAVLLLRYDTLPVWVATGGMTALAVIAFLVSRTVGLPQITDEIGNWTEPLAFPAVAAEVLAAVLAGLAVTRRDNRLHDSIGRATS